MFYYFRFVLYQLSKNLNRPFFMDFLTQLRYNIIILVSCLKSNEQSEKENCQRHDGPEGCQSNCHLQLQLLPLQAVHMPKLCLLVAQQWKCCCQAFSCDYGKTSKKKTAFAQFTSLPPPPAHILGNFRTFKKVSKSVWAGGSPPNLDNLSKRKGVLSRKFSLSFRQYIPQKNFNISNHV